MLLACITFGFLKRDELGQLRSVRTACFALATIGTVAFMLAFAAALTLIDVARVYFAGEADLDDNIGHLETAYDLVGIP